MNSHLFDATKWIIRSQQVFRLVSFRYENNQRKFVTDWIQVVISVAVIGLILALNSYFGYDYYMHVLKTDLNDRTKHTRFMVVTVEVISTAICSFYFMFNSILTRHSQITFMDKLQKIDELLYTSFRSSMDPTTFRNVSLTIILSILVYYFAGFLKIVLKFEDLSIFGSFIFNINYLVLASISGIFTLAFICYVTAIFLRTYQLNQKLKEVVRFPPEILETKFESKSKLCLEVMKYTRVYRLLCTSVGDLNQIFGFSLVMNFAHDFILLTSLIFMMFYLTFYDGWEASKDKVFIYFVWLFPNAMKITFSCLACHFTRNEIETCSQYLRKFSYEANEDDITDLVDMFALQSIHLKTEFTANNFFSIDMSLFYNIISACTTYLVILIQFKNYDDEVDNELKGNATNSSAA
ncbi:hypothetical protein ACKWTF_010510 [Chironomus riparius]